MMRNRLLPEKTTLLLLLLALAIYAFHSASMFEYTYDDAFISYRYAKNLSAGHGLVYNIGERVEGYTNFLWTVILAGFIRIGFDPVLVSKVLGIVFAVATMLCCWYFSLWLRGRNDWVNALPLLFLSCSGPFVAWAEWGLEAAMFTFFVVLGLLLFVKARAQAKSLCAASIAFAVAALTRPEGIIFLVACAIYQFFAPVDVGKSRGRAGALLGLLLPFLAVYGPYFAWRYSYYGYLFPNTYYVRMAGSVGLYLQQWVRGLKYIFDYLFRGGGAVVLILIGLFWVLRRPAIKSVEGFLLLLCGLPIIYSMHVGGDSKQLFRLLVPYLPVFYILVARALECIWLLVARAPATHVPRWAVSTVSALFVALLLSYTYWFPTILYLSGGEPDVPLCDALLGRTRAFEAILGFERQKKLVGLWLRKHAPKGTTIATIVAGVTPYYSGLYTYDMLGVTNVHIAHTEPQPYRITSVDVRRTFPERPAGVVENILVTSHQKSDNEYIIRMDPTLILEGYDIAFREAGYKKFLFPTTEFRRYYWAKRPVKFLP